MTRTPCPHRTNVVLSNCPQIPGTARISRTEQSIAKKWRPHDPTRDPQGVVGGGGYSDTALGTHDHGGIDRALSLYFLDNYRKHPCNLVDIKRHWDPTDVFHHPQSIPVS